MSKNRHVAKLPIELKDREEKRRFPGGYWHHSFVIYPTGVTLRFTPAHTQMMCKYSGAKAVCPLPTAKSLKASVHTKHVVAAYLRVFTRQFGSSVIS